MPKQDEVTFSPAEFKQLPLDYIISAPLMATIAAHKSAAETTLAFVKGLNAEGNQEFTREEKVSNGTGEPQTVERKISVPTLALSTIPNLNFDSLSIEFDYAINQVYESKQDKNWGLDGGAKASGLLSGLLNFGLKGSVSSAKSQTNSINKSGKLSIRLHASESELPEGMQMVLNWLTQSVDMQNDNSAPPAPAQPTKPAKPAKPQ